MIARSSLPWSPGAAGPLLTGALDLSWQDAGACQYTDPDLGIPEKGGSTREAKRICQGCPVQARCLEYALDNEIMFGIWGGKSPQQRRRLLTGQHEARQAERDELKRTLDKRAAEHHPDGYKTCSRCPDPKPLSAFNYKAGNRDGLAYTCKDCRAEARETLGRAA